MPAKKQEKHCETCSEDGKNTCFGVYCDACFEKAKAFIRNAHRILDRKPPRQRSMKQYKVLLPQ